jgi:hypothetical protein
MTVGAVNVVKQATANNFFRKRKGLVRLQQNS